MPRQWVERNYNLQRWTVLPSGGHFAPMEEPERLVEDFALSSAPCADLLSGVSQWQAVNSTVGQSPRRRCNGSGKRPR